MAIGAGLVFVVFVSLHTRDPRGDVLYLWPALAAGYYLSRRWLVLVLAVLVGADLAFVLGRWPADVALGRWVTVSGGLLVVALLVERLTGQVGRLLDVLGRQAVTDPLTGLANRRGLDEHLDRLDRYSGDGGGAERIVSLVLVDLDGFKRSTTSSVMPQGTSCSRRSRVGWPGRRRWETSWPGWVETSSSSSPRCRAPPR